MQGCLSKMKTELNAPVSYQMPVGESLLPLNELLGKTLRLTYTGQIFCTYCNRKTNKSFNQGYCYPCFKKLAQCDSCIIKPEQCHYDLGTCREPEWAQSHCFQPHFVYLANSSGIKVGITRGNQVPTRWMDQGAIQAIPIAKVASRYQSGLLEIAIGKHVADKTNWRTMLKGAVDVLDMEEERNKISKLCAEDIAELKAQFGDTAIEWLESEAPVNIEYPVMEYPTKVSSHNFDKTPEVGGVLMGIKGQYLMFDTGVINIRKFTAYEVAVEI